MSRLELADIEADFAHIAYMFDDVDGLLDQVPTRGQMEKLCDGMRDLVESRPEFFSRFDYGWTTNPACYPTEVDAWLQHEVLSVLSHISPTHPDLSRHRTTVVRLVPTYDFAATTVNGELCDYILIAQPYLSLAREFAVLLRRLHEVSPTEGSDPRRLTPSWIAEAVNDLVAAGTDPSDLLLPMQKHAVALATGKQPRQQPPLLDNWIADGIGEGSPLAIELAVLYQGIDKFLLFHELAHLLHGDSSRRPRTPKNELRADRGALSLALIQLEILSPSDSAHRDLLHARIVREVLHGGPAYLQLMRLVTLFSEAHRWTAVMSDIAFGTNQEPLRDAGQALHELEERLVHIVAVAKDFVSPEAAAFTLAQIVSLEHLVICAKLLLLKEFDNPRRFEDFLPIDLLRFAKGSTGEADPQSSGPQC